VKLLEYRRYLIEFNRYSHSLGESNFHFQFTPKYRRDVFKDVILKKAEENQYDGNQVFVTTEMDLTEREIIVSYRIRDQIEKAIRTLKHILAFTPNT